MDKAKLDEIIEKHKAQPVGQGYIDIIVSRGNYKDLIADLMSNEFNIESISWWEQCDNDNKNEYGLGGPKSYYYDCWFSELSIDVDDIKLDKQMTIENKVKHILDRIEVKTISFPNATITFKGNNWLTPAIWLDVPKDWRNKYCA